MAHRFFFAVPLDFLLAHEDLARGQGVHVEVFADGDVLESLDPARVKAARALLDSAGIRRRVHGPISEMALGAFDPRVREVARLRYGQSIGFAAALAAEAIVVHSGFDVLNKRDLADRYFAQFAPALRSVAEEAAGKGLRLLVENTFEPGPGLILDAVAAAAAPNVGLLFDVAHHHVYAKAPLSEWLDRWGTRIEEVHVTDNDGEWDHHLAPGKGRIDFAAFFAALKERSLRPVYTFEPHDLEAFGETIGFIRAHPEYFS